MEAFNSQVERTTNSQLDAEETLPHQHAGFPYLLKTVGQMKGRKVTMTCNCQDTSQKVTF